MFPTLLSIALALGAASGTHATTTRTQVLGQEPLDAVQKSYEQLEGFGGVIVKQINKVFGTDRLPAANGFPVEPGMYLTLGSNQMTIFDGVGATLAGGVPTDTTAAAECKSGCSRAFFDALRLSWLDLSNEGAAIGDDMPTRVLIAAEAMIPARSFVDLAYAAAESRPGSVPNLYLLLNAGPGGLRSRNFSLVPPGGIKIGGTSNALGLRIIVQGGATFEVGSADGRTVAKQTINGSEALSAFLSGLDRKFPSKDVVVLQVGPAASVGDLVQAMVLTEARFPIPVLSMGDQIRL